LLGRLGWTLWRAGPVEEAPDVLRRAIEEARACGADEAERYAIHDLGVALAILGRTAEAVVPIEESLVMARAAGDRALLMRCYINVPSIKSTNGAPPREVMPFAEEGAEAARRTMDLAS